MGLEIEEGGAEEEVKEKIMAKVYVLINFRSTKTKKAEV